jgi:N-acetyl-alpha-D-glucosaminyl L-malate synthase BshA
MRIGISCYPSFGGSGAVAAELALELAHRGHQVHLVSARRPFRLSVHDYGVQFHPVDIVDYPLLAHSPYVLSLAEKIYEVSQTQQLDVFHVHYAVPDAMAAYLAKQMLGPNSPKIVCTMHGTDVTHVGSDPSLFEVTRFTLGQMDALTSVSKFLTQRAREIFCSFLDIETIYNFVDTKRFKPQPCPQQRKSIAPRNERILTHMSNFRPVKRSEDVVRVFARVRQHLNAKLLMIGDGIDRLRCQGLAERLGIEGEVVFLGQESEIEKYLAVTDLFVMTSASESFGLAALEAMSSGAPVIGTSCGGLHEVLGTETANPAGRLSDIGDVQKMAADAVEILCDDSLHQGMSHAARQRAENLFDASIIIPQYEALYERLISKPQRVGMAVIEPTEVATAADSHCTNV